MRRAIQSCTLLLVACVAMAARAEPPAAAPSGGGDRPVALVIHGGAGVIERSALSTKEEAAVRADLDRALDAGQAVLAGGGTALDAVEAAILVLEDSPRFNAGKGAVFDAEGRRYQRCAGGPRTRARPPPTATSPRPPAPAA